MSKQNKKLKDDTTISQLSEKETEKLLSSYEKLMSDKEWLPEDDENKFETIKMDSTTLSKYKDLPQLEISITPTIVQNAKKCFDIKQILKDKIKYVGPSNYIYKIIKIYDDNDMSYISYTRNSIEFVMKTLIIKTFSEEKTKSKFDEFKDMLKVKLKLIGCYKSKEEIPLKQLNKIKESFEDGNQINKTTDIMSFDNILKNYQTEIKLCVDKYIDKTKFTIKKYFIYKIVDKGNDLSQYIFGSFEKLKKTDVKVFIDIHNLNFSNKMELKILEEINCQTDIEGQICVDKLIHSNNSIDGGQNLCYNIIKDHEDDSKINSFMTIQKEIINLTFEDDNNYKNIVGYIATIKISNKKFIIGEKSTTTIKDKLIEIYSCYTKDEYKDFRCVEFKNLIVRLIEKINDDKKINIKKHFYMNAFGLNKNVVEQKKKQLNSRSMYAFLKHKK